MEVKVLETAVAWPRRCSKHCPMCTRPTIVNPPARNSEAPQRVKLVKKVKSAIGRKAVFFPAETTLPLRWKGVAVMRVLWRSSGTPAREG